MYYNLVSQVDSSKYGCCIAGKYNDGSACTGCASNCKHCTSTAASTCTQGSDGTINVNGGWYLNGGSMTSCSANFLTCFNTGVDLEFGEICFYGDKFYYNDGGGAMVAECAPASQVGNCDHVWYDIASTAYKCMMCTVSGDYS